MPVIQGWITLPAAKALGGALACPSVRYLPSDGYYYTISGGNIIPLMRSKDLLVWETAAGASAPFIQSSPGDIKVASSIMSSAASNLANGHANLSFPHREIWDKDANDADFCCESWGGASPEKGGPTISYVLWWVTRNQLPRLLSCDVCNLMPMMVAVAVQRAPSPVSYSGCLVMIVSGQIKCAGVRTGRGAQGLRPGPRASQPLGPRI